MKQKLFTGEGFLTDKGTIYFEHFQNALNIVFSDLDELEGPLTEQEIKTIGCVLAKMVGDKTSERLMALRESKKLNGTLWAMSDEEYKYYLKNKYGNNWNNITITPEEMERYITIASKQVDDVLQQIKKDRAETPTFYPTKTWFSRRRFYK